MAPENGAKSLTIGIDGEGSKNALDLEQGRSESKAVVTVLIDRLRERWIEENDERRLLVIRDGSPAIESAVRSHWPAALQQEWLIHQERNTCPKLRKRDKAETIQHFKRLREAQGKEAGEEAFDDLLDFISERNVAAGLAFKARKDSLLTVHRLEIPWPLNGTLTNTNIIESKCSGDRQPLGCIEGAKHDLQLAGSDQQREALERKRNNDSPLGRKWDALG